MSVIGEAVLSVTIEMLIEKLVSDVLLRFGCQEPILADLKKWEKMLMKIRAVLDDADEKQMTNRLVKIWLGELQNLAYDVEDILDEFATEGLRRKLLLEPQTQATKSKVRKLISSHFTSLNSRSFKFNSEMVAQIKQISTRLQNIATEKDQLGLEKNLGGRFNTVKQTPPTTSLVNEAKVYGREEDKEAILKTLLRDDLSTDDGVPVISIVGMGGIGKTTLAQLIYNDVKVENHFDINAWVHVSDDFDITKTTKSILRSIAPGNSDDNDLNMFQIELKQQLLKRKFLLVSDDIWNENYGDWNALCSPFEVGALGSKILVTTRNQSVSSIMSTLPTYTLRELSHDDCLCIFTQHSLGTRDFSMHQHLKEVGEKIVKKCKGLPLAVKTLGGLLRGKYDVNNWEYVLNSKIWDLPEGTCNVIPALRISYHYLPSHLKRCFAYCSIFPKGYEFQEKEITLLWMAEGFLQHEITEMQLEDVGHKAFFELLSRSFFQQSSINSSLFFMHDLINDLAQWAAGKICLRLENIGEGDKIERISENLRHLSCTASSSCAASSFYGFKSFEASRYLRTFLPLIPRSYMALKSSVGCNVCYILSKLSRLRVLSLRNHCISCCR
ncbi:putative disease resistance RPP13-like protein 1 [Pistacia vera]|uniref:putative disease resistance RPP13-like protein 1 n=1 Tax=Pistacia vera TaxID=55513 RepID=UPI001263D790|nr:putative disease resistance RPP13-like protein 1 [Pistacia vera]